MTTLTVELPSGMKGRVRGLKTKELELLGNQKAMRTGEAMEDILQACWVETIDFGPAYRGGKFTWEEALQGDRFKALLDARRATYWHPEDGELSLDFDIQCERCGEKVKWSVWLGDLRAQPYPQASLHKHLAGEPFEALVGGRKVQYRLVTGKEEKKLNELIRTEKSPLVASLAYRMTDVEGIGSDKHDIRKWLREVDVMDVTLFREEFDKVGGGVDTTLDVECRCGGRTTVELPFGTRDYWLPKKPGSPRPKKRTGESSTTMSGTGADSSAEASSLRSDSTS